MRLVGRGDAGEEERKRSSTEPALPYLTQYHSFSTQNQRTFCYNNFNAIANLNRQRRTTGLHLKLFCDTAVSTFLVVEGGFFAFQFCFYFF